MAQAQEEKENLSFFSFVVEGQSSTLLLPYRPPVVDNKVYFISIDMIANKVSAIVNVGMNFSIYRRKELKKK